MRPAVRGPSVNQSAAPAVRGAGSSAPAVFIPGHRGPVRTTALSPAATSVQPIQQSQPPQAARTPTVPRAAGSDSRSAPRRPAAQDRSATGVRAPSVTTPSRTEPPRQEPQVQPEPAQPPPEIDLRPRIARVTKLWNEAKEALEHERLDAAACNKTLQAGYDQHENLTRNLVDCQQSTQNKRAALDKSQIELGKYHGEGLEECPEEDLESVADALSRALQKATIAQASRQAAAGSQMEDNIDGETCLPSEGSPDEDDAAEDLGVPHPPPKNAGTGHAMGLLAQLADELSSLQRHHHVEYAAQLASEQRLMEVQRQISALSAEYVAAREALRQVEASRRQAQMELAQLRGEHSLAHLSSDGLQDLCSNIVKHSRKVHLCHAVRQLRGQGFGMDPLLKEELERLRAENAQLKINASASTSAPAAPRQRLYMSQPHGMGST